jgi:RNA polymerase sigma factor (sigma-70 family)
VGGLDTVRLYLDEAGHFPLLTKEDEVALAKAIEAGRAAKDELGTEGLSSYRRRKLRESVRAGDAAFERFVNCNLRLVVSIAKRYQWSKLPLSDLLQEGNLGLMHAVEKFNWRMGYKFSTYATWWIRQAVGRAIDNTAGTVRLPAHVGDQGRHARRAQRELTELNGEEPSLAELADEMGVDEKSLAVILNWDDGLMSLDSPVGEGETSLGELAVGGAPEEVPDAAIAALVSERIEKALAQLSETEQAIVKLFYWGRVPLKEVAFRLGMSPKDVNYTKRRALDRLEGILGDEGRELLAG